MDLRSLLKRAVVKQLLPPQVKNNGAFAGNTYIDTQGLSSLLVLIALGTTDVTVGSTNAATTPLLVEECDTAGGTYTAVTGAALAAVLAATDDNKTFGIHIDLTKTHKRYMRVQAPTAANSTGANLAILALGFPAEQMPASADQMGLAALVEA